MDIIYSINFWLIVGLSLAILEIFSGLFIALAFSVASFVIAAVLWLWPEVAIQWYAMLFIYSVVGFVVASLGWQRILRKQGQTPDIND